MTMSHPVSPKIIHVIGDSHALAFKGKSIHLEDHNIVATANVCYVRGLSLLNLLDGSAVPPEISDYILQQGIGGKEGRSLAVTKDSAAIAEQYATGKGFQRHILLFFAGEIYVRKFLGTIHTFPKLDMKLIESSFRKVIVKYLEDLRTLRDAFNCLAFVHTLSPPTADDDAFAAINKFHCSRELRAEIYKLFNHALIEVANAMAISWVRDISLIADDGSLKSEYEFDGVHADPKYAFKSLDIVTRKWLTSRTAEFSARYVRWADQFDENTPNAITAEPVKNLGICFDDAQVAQLREALDVFDVAVSKAPLIDWAHLPLEKGYKKYNEVVKYARVTSPGLKLLYDILIAGEIGQAVRAHLGADFSVVNCRAVQSLPHENEGVGQQDFHRDSCPPGIFRGLIYLVDVDETGGPFEYKASDEADRPTQVLGKAGSLLIFDANAVAHRACPPRSRIRLAIDLVILIHPPICTPIVHSHPFCTWPIDPYLFELPNESYPPLKDGRWFYPALIMPQKTNAAVKKLTAQEMAASGLA